MPPRKILKKVVYSRRKIEIIRKNLSPRVDLPAQRGGGGLKPPKPPALATAMYRFAVYVYPVL